MDMSITVLSKPKDVYEEGDGDIDDSVCAPPTFDFKLKMDDCGNLYLDGTNIDDRDQYFHKKPSIYQITINRFNRLDGEDGDYHLLDGGEEKLDEGNEGNEGNDNLEVKKPLNDSIKKLLIDEDDNEIENEDLDINDVDSHDDINNIDNNANFSRISIKKKNRRKPRNRVRFDPSINSSTKDNTKESNNPISEEEKMARKQEQEIENMFKQEKIIQEQEMKKYFPEDDDYEEVGAESDFSENDDTEYFTFSSFSGSSIPVNKRYNGDIVALYETLVYDKDSQVSFKSKLHGGTLMFRVLVYEKDGKITLKPTGSKMTSFTPTIDRDGKLEFEVCS